jgi:glycosyltransferase involved in cell wall biosynthesis
MSEPGSARLAEIARGCDLVVFLDGRARPDPCLILRAAHLAAASDRVVQPILPMRAGAGPLETPFAALPETNLTRFPFRDVLGFNLAVPAALLRAAGSPDPRFVSETPAARELAFRMHRLGAWFAPLTVPGPAWEVEPSTPEDVDLLRATTPNAWTRKKGGRFEVPRVSVYIPAFNASRYLRAAVESVLEQDFEDLEVCVADDGSTDGTPELLERMAEEDDRVRWTRLANGGIGWASNRAIAMSRGPYVGQLDSDDRLKPGAVRRLVDTLDGDPKLACAYGSAERIDAKGEYVKDEYAWPVFSREKMMVTSIAHHFRMFRRAAFERTAGFREDITNAVDYDLFLKLSEAGPLRHVEEVLYQRRWHGENTSAVNEDAQTENTWRVQRQALRRQGLERYWEVFIPNPDKPRRVSYRRRWGHSLVMMWPHYRDNPYQHLLYAGLEDRAEIVIGDIDAAIEAQERLKRRGPVVFHLHWLNALLRGVTDPAMARAAVDGFVARLERFVQGGGRLVWTIHNTLSHDGPFRDLEVALSGRIAELAHALHVHSEASISEIAAHFDLPRDKVHVSRHGSYVGAYPDRVDRATARAQLGLDPSDEVILFSGQVRPYKGVEELVSVFRRLLAERPRLRLLIAGEAKHDPLAEISPALTPGEAARIHMTGRFLNDDELQLFFRAADIAVYPYRAILTSGSLLAAMSFGLPAAIPAVGMTRELMEGRDVGALYDGAGGEAALEGALRGLLGRLDDGTLGQVGANARALAEATTWPDFGTVLLGPDT